MELAWSFLKRDVQIAASYRTVFLLQLAGIFMAVPMFFFLGKGIGGAVMPAEYRGDYFAYVLLGIAFLDFHHVSLRTFSQSLRDSQMMGTLELVLLSPTSLAKVLLYSSLWPYLLTTLRFLVYLLVGALFGLKFNANPVGAALVLLLGILSFAALGIIASTLIMLLKSAMGFTSLLSMASLFFGGVLYSNTVLPEWLRPVSLLLPITHALGGMRRALLDGASLRDLTPTLGVLALFAAVLLPLSLTAFWLAVRQTKRSGTLAQY